MAIYQLDSVFEIYPYGCHRFNTLLPIHPTVMRIANAEIHPENFNILPWRAHFRLSSEYLIPPKLTIVYSGTIPVHGTYRYNKSSAIFLILYPMEITPLAIS